jgi:hypothetical protein
MELRVPETTADGRIIADLTDYLPDWMTFSADRGSEAGPFLIEETGIVRLAPGSRLDYETRSIYRLIVRAIPVEIDRDPWFDSFAEVLQADGLTEQGIAKLQSHERRFAVRISIEDESETPAPAPLPIRPGHQESRVVDATVPSPQVLRSDTTVPTPAADVSVVNVQKPAPVQIARPIPLRPLQPVRLQPHTSQSVPAEEADVTAGKESATDAGEGITRASSLRFRIAAVILIFGLGYLLKRVQRPVQDPAEEAAFDEKVVDEIEARIAASFTPAKASEPDVSASRLTGSELNSMEADDENESSTEVSYVLDEIGDYEIPAAPTMSDPESLVGAEYYNVEEPFIISEDDAELRRIEQLQELQSCLEERNQRIVTLERQMQSLRGKLEQVTAHLALRAAGSVSDDSSMAELPNPLRSFAEEPSGENDDRLPRNVVGVATDSESQAAWLTSPSDPLRQEPSAADPERHSSATATILRPELAELFGMQNSGAAPEAQSAESARRNDEESHLDSVATYLDGLLQRSQLTTESEGQGSGRGRTKQSVSRSGEKTTPQKRGSAPSYMESWLQDHPNPAEVSDAKLDAAVIEPPASQPLAPRRPVDVEAARGHMKSLRQVAIQSAQQAVGESRLRTARNRMIRRTVLLMGLSLIAILAVVTDVFRRFSESSLGSTIWALLILTAAQLSLRIDSIRRHRQEMIVRMRAEGFLQTSSLPHTRTESIPLIPSSSGPDSLSGQLADPQTAKLNG